MSEAVPNADTFDPALMVWVLTQDALNELLVAIEQADLVVLDLETTGLHEYATHNGPLNGGVAGRIVLASLTLPSGDAPARTWVVPLSHPEGPWQGRWRDIMSQIAARIKVCEKPLANQNVKFDARWIYAHTGVDLSACIVWDTQVSSHLLDETSSTRLKDRAPKTFGIRAWDDFDLSTPGAAERVPVFDLGAYAARDTYWTWQLMMRHQEDMFISSPLPDDLSPDDIINARLGKLCTWLTMPMVASLTAIEQRGICVDTGWIENTLAAEEQTAAELFEKLAHRYPDLPAEDASFAPTSHWFRAWADLAVQSGDLTPTGKPQWSKGVLMRQARAGSEVAEQLLEMRRAMKRAEFLRAWRLFVAPDGKIHTTYHAGRVITGRLSSSDPNVQQITAALKDAFEASPGHVVIDLDYSQIELRAAAFISRCEPMIAAFIRGDDLHTLLAAKITGKAPEDITPAERQAGKSANFGLLYMMGPYGFMEYAETVYGVHFTLEESTLVHRAFYEMWVGIGAWHNRAIARVRQTGQIVSPIGRVRRLPGIWDGNEERSAYAERAAVNAPVQGFASDLMQLAAASIGGLLPGQPPVKGARIIGTVHDSILVEAPEGDYERVTQECADRMLNLHDVLRKLNCELDVPLAVEAKIGTRWGRSDIGKYSATGSIG